MYGINLKKLANICLSRLIEPQSVLKLNVEQKLQQIYVWNPNQIPVNQLANWEVNLSN